MCVEIDTYYMWNKMIVSVCLCVAVAGIFFMFYVNVSQVYFFNFFFVDKLLLVFNGKC